VVAHPPVNTVPEEQKVISGTPVILAGISVEDEDGDLATVQLRVTNGGIKVNLAGKTAIADGASGTNVLTLSGTEDEINATLASLTYEAAPNYTGLDTLTVISTDRKHLIDTDMMTIKVTASIDVSETESNEGLAVRGNRFVDQPERKLQESESQTNLIGQMPSFFGATLSVGLIAWKMLFPWKRRRRRKKLDLKTRAERETKQLRGQNRGVKSPSRMDKEDESGQGRESKT
jgi:hypothetical protein